MSMQELGEELRTLRLKKGLKQTDVADIVHLSREMVSNYERGNTQGIGGQTLHLWAVYLEGDEPQLKKLAGQHLTITEVYDRVPRDPIREALRRRLKDDATGDFQFELLMRITDVVQAVFAELADDEPPADARDSGQGAA